MKKILTIGFAALVTASALATSAVPASAGGHGHGWRHKNHWVYDYRWDDRWYGQRSSWRAHVRWCEHRHRSYDRSTNLFRTSHGHWRQCRSPFI